MACSKMLSLFCFCCSIVSVPLVASQIFSPRVLAAHDAEEIERLVKQLGSEDFREREAAMESLRRIGRATLPALRKAQSSADAEIRRRAKKLLDQMGVTVQSLLNRHASIRYYKNQKPAPTSIREIDMVGSAFSDYDLILVGEFENLRWLDLDLAHVTNAGLRQIGHLTNLERLDMSDTLVSDISALRKCSKLIWLGLGSTRITDRDLEHIKHFPNLETLNIGGTNITDAGLARLKHLKKLRQLNLVDTKITDKGLGYLTNFKELEYLRMDGTQITDAGLGHLKKLKKLKYILLHRTKVTANGIVDLKKSLPNLD